MATKDETHYVEAAAPPQETDSPKISRRTFMLAVSLFAVCVGVVCIVAAVTLNFGQSDNNQQESHEAQARTTDRPDGTPFVHTPSCPVMQFCRDSYRSSDAKTKNSELLKKVKENTNSGPEASVTDQLGILDPSGIVDPNANPFLYAIEYLLAQFGTGILNALKDGLDVRTTFSQGLDWQNLKQVYTTGDQLEIGRPKSIHAVGVTGAVTFDTSGVPRHPFTGMLKDGFEGIVRFSSAVPITRGSTKKRYILFGPDDVKTPFQVAPGLGLKAPVSGSDSADLVAMWHLDGQPGEWNFFAHEFSTVVPGSNKTPLKLVGKHFEDASKCPSHVSVLSFAETSQSGQRVENPKAPYSLIFVPDPDLKSRFDRMVDDGFLPSEVHACESEDKCPDVLNSLANLPSGQPLYKIYAIESPAVRGWVGEAGRYETFNPSKPPQGVFLLGTLRISTGQRLLRSYFGDTGLFFRHRLFEDGLLNALCVHNNNWLPLLRTSQPVLDRNHPTCALGGNDDDGTDTEFRKEIVCRLMFRAYAIYPSCTQKLIDMWNHSDFFPFERSYDQFSGDWLDWCGRDSRPISDASRQMVVQSFS